MARYQLRVQARFERLDDQGRYMGGPGGFALEEVAEIEAQGWVEVSAKLARFDDLITELRDGAAAATGNKYEQAVTALAQAKREFGNPDRGVTEH
jgi:hypothetical protein